MNKRNINILSGIIVSFLVLLILGCGGRSGNETATSGGQQSAKYKDLSDGAMQDNDGMLEIVDIAGRTVNIPTGGVNVIIQSRMIYAIAPLFGKDGNLFKHIAAWHDPLEKNDPDAYELYVEKFPDIASIPIIGSPHKGSFSIEQAITLKIDIVIMNLNNLFKSLETGMIEKLDKAGIKTIFVDFRQRPTQHTVPSILLLGQVFDKQMEARKVINFYLVEMQKVYTVVAQIEEDKNPLVFMESAAGHRECCTVWGSSSMGRFVELAGGKNYGTIFFGSTRGKINPEQLLIDEPDIIIGTGANWSKGKSSTGAVLLGYKAKNKDTQKQLQAIILHRPGWKTLQAVKNKRVYSIYHQFYNSPYHFIAIQQIAKWIYPKKFADLDPEKTFIEFHDKFLPISYSGMFWASLE